MIGVNLTPQGGEALAVVFGVKGGEVPKERRRKYRRGISELPPGRDGKPRYEASWKYQGRRIRRRFTTVTMAERCLDAVRGQIVEERYLDKRKEVKTLFEALTERFLKWSEVSVRPATYKEDKRFVKLWHESPHFKGKTLDRITSGDVEAHKIERVGVVSQRSVDAELSRLRRMFSLAVAWKLCRENPVKGVKFFNPPCQRERILEPEEETDLLAAAPTLLRSCILFTLHTGLRLREMLTLTWGEVDKKRGRFGYITVTAERAKGKRARHIPLTETARRALDDLPKGISESTLVFPQYGGILFGKKKNEAASFYRQWLDTLEAAKLNGKGLTWHSLRHTYASRLVMAGVDLVTVQRLLGHANITMTMRYAHLSPGYLEDAVTALDGGQKCQKSASGADGGRA